WDILFQQQKISTDKTETLAQIREFVLLRFKNELLERGFRYDLVDAVLSSEYSLSNLYASQEKLKELSAWLSQGDANETVMALARIIRICKEKIEWEIRENLFEKEEEKQLYHIFSELKPQLEKMKVDYQYSEYLQALNKLVKPINNFFDHV